MGKEAPFGFTDHQWDEMVSAAGEFLGQTAARELLTSYTELSEQVHRRTGCRINPHDYAMNHLLELVGRASFAETGAIATALVIYKDGNDPGAGFFALGQSLGLLPEGHLRDSAKDAFWARQVEASHATQPR